LGGGSFTGREKTGVAGEKALQNFGLRQKGWGKKYNPSPRRKETKGKKKCPRGATKVSKRTKI